MALPFLAQAQLQSPANADLTRPFALLGDTIGQGIRGLKRQSLLGDVAEALKTGDHQSAALRLIEGGEMESGLALLKMKAEQDEGNLLGSGFRNLFGGGQTPQPQPASLTPAPMQPSQPE
jgi:hypothetical protein